MAAGQRHDMLLAHLHALARNTPFNLSEIDLPVTAPSQLTGANKDHRNLLERLVDPAGVEPATY